MSKTVKEYTVNPDGTISFKIPNKIKTDVSTKLTFAEELELMYPTPNADKLFENEEFTKFDEHKFYK